MRNPLASLYCAMQCVRPERRYPSETLVLPLPRRPMVSQSCTNVTSDMGINALPLSTSRIEDRNTENIPLSMLNGAC